MIHEHLFDVKLFASIRIFEADEAAARKALAEMLDCASITIQHPRLGSLTFEASIDGEADLMEVDGKAA